MRIPVSRRQPCASAEMPAAIREQDDAGPTGVLVVDRSDGSALRSTVLCVCERFARFCVVRLWDGFAADRCEGAGEDKGAGGDQTTVTDADEDGHQSGENKRGTEQ